MRVARKPLARLRTIARADDESYVPEGYQAMKTPQGTIYVVSKRAPCMSAPHIAIPTQPKETEETQRKRKELPCYWIPSKTPAVESKVRGRYNTHGFGSCG